MATTYIDLVNELLRRVNEVTIDQADFPSVRGIQGMAKDIINASIEEINSLEFEWPFNAVNGTQVLVVGTEEYDFPSTLKAIKWDSFHLTADDALNTAGHPIRFISRDERHRYAKNDDDVAGADGLNEPLYVFEKHGFGFGVTPSPDETYTVTYEYFAQPVALSLYNDTSTIPSSYDEAIIQSALYHMYMFRDNSEQAKIAEDKAKKLIGRMRTMLINKEDRIRSTMIISRRPSGGIMSNDYFRY